MGFSWQESWSGLLWPPPEDHSNPWIQPKSRDWTHISSVSCIGRQVLTTSATWEAHTYMGTYTHRDTHTHIVCMEFSADSVVKNPPAKEIKGLIPGSGRSPGEGICSSILAWRSPWTKKPGGLWSIESQRVSHNWVIEHICIHCVSLYLSIYLYISTYIVY